MSFEEFNEYVAAVNALTTEIERLRFDLHEATKRADERNQTVLQLEAELDVMDANFIARSQECDQLREDAQLIYTQYMERGMAMRETGDMVRSIYAPKNEKLNKQVGRLTAALTKILNVTGRPQAAGTRKVVHEIAYEALEKNEKG